MPQRQLHSLGLPRNCEIGGSDLKWRQVPVVCLILSFASNIAAPNFFCLLPLSKFHLRGKITSNFKTMRIWNSLDCLPDSSLFIHHQEDGGSLWKHRDIQMPLNSFQKTRLPFALFQSSAHQRCPGNDPVNSQVSLWLGELGITVFCFISLEAQSFGIKTFCLFSQQHGYESQGRERLSRIVCVMTSSKSSHMQLLYIALVSSARCGWLGLPEACQYSFSLQGWSVVTACALASCQEKIQ